MLTEDGQRTEIQATKPITRWTRILLFTVKSEKNTIKLVKIKIEMNILGDLIKNIKNEKQLQKVDRVYKNKS